MQDQTNEADYLLDQTNKITTLHFMLFILSFGLFIIFLFIYILLILYLYYLLLYLLYYLPRFCCAICYLINFFRI